MHAKLLFTLPKNLLFYLPTLRKMLCIPYIKLLFMLTAPRMFPYKHTKLTPLAKPPFTLAKST